MDLYCQTKGLQILPKGIRYNKFFKPYLSPPQINLVEPQEVFTLIKDFLIENCCAESHTDFIKICSNPLWTNSEFFIRLPFKKNEDVKPTKASHSGMNPEHLKLAEQECQELLKHGLIEETNSQWSCEAFYVNKRSEQLLEKALENSGNDLDSAIRSLHELRLAYAECHSSSEENANVEKGATPTGEDAFPLKELQVQTNLPVDGAEWVDLFVREMMCATSIDNTRSRAASILESLEKSIRSQASMEAAQDFHKENVMLKEQIDVLLRDKMILKRAVAIQHEGQKEYNERNKEVQQLKQLVSQYQEQLQILQVNNYALTLHLQQARQRVSIPGRFHSDVF